MFRDKPYCDAALTRVRDKRTNQLASKMPKLTTCDNCHLPYYQTSAPHVCAGGVSGGICKSHGLAVLVTHVNDGEPCADYLTSTEHEPVARGGEGEHSPLPWKVAEHDFICSGDSTVAELTYCAQPKNERRANATLIVTAVNQHHSLLAERDRLRSALEVIRDSFWSEGEPYGERVEHLQQLAKDALDDQKGVTSADQKAGRGDGDRH